MDLNYEKLRTKFVDFGDKKDLFMCVDDFEKGDKNNNWPSVFSDLSTQISKNIGVENH